MAVAFVQGAFARTGAATTLSPALTGVTAGNTLVLAITGFRTTTALPTSVSDGVNTWRRVADLAYASATNRVMIYIATNVAGGDTTVTATWASNFLGTAHLSEWSGVDPITPGDVWSGSTGSGFTPTTATTPAIEQSGSVALALVGASTGNSSSGLTVPSGYTSVHVEQNGLDYEVFGLAYKEISTAGSTEAPGWSMGVSGSWGTRCYVLRPPGGRAVRYIGGQTAQFAGATTTANITLALTGGAEQLPAEGDLILVNYTVGTAGRNPAQTITGNQSGAYPHVTGSPLLEAGDTYDTDLALFYQFAGATPDTVLTRSGTGNAADGGAVIIHVYRNVDPTTPFDVTPTTATGINTDRANPPAITPVTDGALIVVAAGGAAATLTTAWTAAYLSNLLQANGADTNDGRAALGNVAWTSGAYDPAAFTGGSGNANNSWAAITLALRPAPSGGGGTTYDDTIEDGLTAGDSFDQVVTFGAALTDGTTAGEAWATTAVMALAFSDAAAAGEAWVAGLVLAAAISDAATTGDTMAPGLVIGASFSDGATGGEAFGSQGTFNPAIAETGVAGEAWATTATMAAIFADGPTAGEAFTAGFTFTATFSDAATSGDSFASRMTMGNALTDGLTAADAFTAARSLNLSFSDGITSADSLLVGLAIAVALSDAATAGDGMADGGGGTFDETIEDAAVPGDAMTATVVFAAALQDGSAAGDVMDAGAVYAGLAFTDGATAGDAMAGDVPAPPAPGSEGGVMTDMQGGMLRNPLTSALRTGRLTGPGNKV